MKTTNGTTVWLPADLVCLIDKIKEMRRDPTRSDTVRYLVLRALADLGFLPADTRRALGIG